jgi:hypothetical protein
VFIVHSVILPVWNLSRQALHLQFSLKSTYDNYMKRTFCLVFSLLTFICSVLLLTSNAYADHLYPYTVDPSGNLTEQTPSATVTINSLHQGTTYWVCLNTKPQVKMCRTLDNQSGTAKFTVQPASASEALLQFSSSNQNTSAHFIGHNSYVINIFENNITTGEGVVIKSVDDVIKNPTLATGFVRVENAIENIQLDTATTAPKLSIKSPEQNKIFPGTPIVFTVTADTNPGDSSRNNYTIVVSKQDGGKETTKDRQCAALQPSSGSTGSVDITVGQGNTTFDSGNYIARLYEQTNESNQTCDSASVNFAEVPFSVAASGGTAGAVINKDVDQFVFNPASSAAVPPPCAKPLDSTGNCPEFASGIGNILTNPTAFISNLFRILLGISGGIAVMLIIYSGFRVATAAGDAKAVQGARETMTSAVIGLLFLIFSFVILEVIGVDILHIPGLGATTANQQIPTAKTNR